MATSHSSPFSLRDINVSSDFLLVGRHCSRHFFLTRCDTFQKSMLFDHQLHQSDGWEGS